MKLFSNVVEISKRNLSAALMYDISRQACPINSIDEVTPDSNIWQIFNRLNGGIKEFDNFKASILFFSVIPTKTK
jgi:hypothetical protein